MAHPEQLLESPTPALELRTWCYVQYPKVFDIAPCSCGNHETQWSEFKKHLWCDKCEKDFVPEHNGVFDGPIAVNISKMFGVTFDRIDLATQALQRFNLETRTYDAPTPAPDISPETVTAP